MGILDRFKRRTKQNKEQLYGEGADELMEWLGINPKSKEEISEVTYFTCIKKLSEAMGKLPLKYYQEVEGSKNRMEPSEACRLLTIRPNPYMTPTTLWTTTEFNCQHHGNGYIWIQREFIPQKFGGEQSIKGLYPLAPENVRIIMDDAGIFGGAGDLYYEYSDQRTGKQYLFRNDEIMHFKTWFSTDGIVGKSVREVLKDSVKGASSQQEVMNTQYEQGVTASMVMYYTTDLDEPRIAKLKEKFSDQLTKPQNAGKIVPIPQGLSLQPLSMNFADVQFYELRKYSALQIAAAFGIKPNQINNYEKSSYSNSEMQQLDFLVDTLLYRIRQYEDEINAKILTPAEIAENKYYKYNDRAMLRADTTTQMTALCQGVGNFIYKPNEARSYLDMPWAEGGDQLIGNGNYIPVGMVGTQYSREGGNTDGED